MSEQDQWVEVARLDDMMEGEGYDSGEEVDGDVVGLFLVDGKVYAVGECTHESGPICQGQPVDFVVRCPWHSAKFDIRTGKCIEGPVACRTEGNVGVGEEEEIDRIRALKCYDVKIEGEAILVRSRGN